MDEACCRLDTKLHGQVQARGNTCLECPLPCPSAERDTPVTDYTVRQDPRFKFKRVGDMEVPMLCHPSKKIGNDKLYPMESVLVDGYNAL